MMNKYAMKSIALALAIVAITAGCMTKAPNQVQQQAVRTQQAQNLPQTATDNRVQIANAAADRITKIPGVKSANVLVARRNAYVAAVVNTGQGQLSRDMESQIAQQVRSTDPNIQNVYVSTNPQFVDRVNRYVTDVRLGHPVAGFFDEFTQMVQRVFPNAK